MESIRDRVKSFVFGGRQTGRHTAPTSPNANDVTVVMSDNDNSSRNNYNNNNGNGDGDDVSPLSPSDLRFATMPRQERGLEASGHDNYSYSNNNNSNNNDNDNRNNNNEMDQEQRQTRRNGNNNRESGRRSSSSGQRTSWGLFGGGGGGGGSGRNNQQQQPSPRVRTNSAGPTFASMERTRNMRPQAQVNPTESSGYSRNRNNGNNQSGDNNNIEYNNGADSPAPMLRSPVSPATATATSPQPAGQGQQQQQQQQQDYKFPVDKPIAIKLVPYNPYFPTVEKELINGACLTVGRYQRSNPRDDPYCEGIYYRSTVVSRKHAQLTFQNGEFFLKDTKSLGGTFVNSTRLSPAGKESGIVKLFHGDVLQLGVDYRPDQRTGQVRNKDKCVEVMVEFPQLFKKKKKGPKPSKWEPTKHQYTECCICISALYQRQALFIAPCAHTFHYRCIAPLLRGKGFQCPMCRQENDLHESVWSLDDAVVSDGEDYADTDNDQQSLPNSPLSAGSDADGAGESSQRTRHAGKSSESRGGVDMPGVEEEDEEEEEMSSQEDLGPSGAGNRSTKFNPSMRPDQLRLSDYGGGDSSTVGHEVYGGDGIYERGDRYRIVGGLSPEGIPDANERMIMIECNGSTDLFQTPDNFIRNADRNDQGRSSDSNNSRLRSQNNVGDGDEDDERYYSGADGGDIRGSGSNEALAGSISVRTETTSAGRSHRSQLTELGDTTDQQQMQQPQPSSTRESSVINLYALNTTTTTALLETDKNIENQ